MTQVKRFGIEIEAIAPSNMGRADLAQQISHLAAVECVYEGYNHTTRPHWKVVTDASLSGDGVCFEVVSPILDGEDGLAQVTRVMDALDRLECTVNRSCGLHVHHDATEWGVKEIKNVSRLWLKYESAVDQIMPASRRGNAGRWCRSNLRTSLARQLAEVSRSAGISAVIESMSGGSRYYKLNLSSKFVHGTVEFRQHSGTVSAEKAVNWVKMTAGFMRAAENAKQINVTGAGKFENLAKIGKDRMLTAYLKRRRLELA